MKDLLILWAYKAWSRPILTGSVTTLLQIAYFDLCTFGLKTMNTIFWPWTVEYERSQKFLQSRVQLRAAAVNLSDDTVSVVDVDVFSSQKLTKYHVRQV